MFLPLRDEPLPAEPTNYPRHRSPGQVRILLSRLGWPCDHPYPPLHHPSGAPFCPACGEPLGRERAVL